MKPGHAGSMPTDHAEKTRPHIVLSHCRRMTDAALRLEHCLSRRGVFCLRRQRDGADRSKGGCSEPGMEIGIGHLLSLLDIRRSYAFLTHGLPNSRSCTR